MIGNHCLLHVKMGVERLTRASVPNEQPLGRVRSVAIIQISGGQHQELCLDWCMNKPISSKVKVEFHDINPIRDIPIMHLMCNLLTLASILLKLSCGNARFCADLYGFDPK